MQNINHLNMVTNRVVLEGDIRDFGSSVLEWLAREKIEEDIIEDYGKRIVLEPTQISLKKIRTRLHKLNHLYQAILPGLDSSCPEIYQGKAYTDQEQRAKEAKGASAPVGTFPRY